MGRLYPRYAEPLSRTGRPVAIALLLFAAAFLCLLPLTFADDEAEAPSGEETPAEGDEQAKEDLSWKVVGEDVDKDGKDDLWTLYDGEGKPGAKDRDTDGDGLPDTRAYLDAEGAAVFSATIEEKCIYRTKDGKEYRRTWFYTRTDGGTARTEITRETYDMNYDGKPDIKVFYRLGGTRRRIEFDIEKRDGFFEKIATLGPKEKVERIDYHNKRGGVLEQTDYYLDGNILKSEIYKGSDGTVSLWRFYKNGKLVKSEHDIDDDGIADYRRLYDEQGKILEEKPIVDNEGEGAEAE